MSADDGGVGVKIEIFIIILKSNKYLSLHIMYSKSLFHVCSVSNFNYFQNCYKINNFPHCYKFLNSICVKLLYSCYYWTYNHKKYCFLIHSKLVLPKIFSTHPQHTFFSLLLYEIINRTQKCENLNVVSVPRLKFVSRRNVLHHKQFSFYV